MMILMSLIKQALIYNGLSKGKQEDIPQEPLFGINEHN